jgi:hypothetical protein
MLKRILPHICIVISVMMLVIYVIDQLNSAMNFIGNSLFKTLLLIYSIAVMATSVYLIADNRRGR